MYKKSHVKAKKSFCHTRWGLMTITTVGNDLHPKTLLGKLIGGFCALSGVSFTPLCHSSLIIYDQLSVKIVPFLFGVFLHL